MINDDLRSKAENGGFLSKRQQRDVSLCIPHCFGTIPGLNVLKGGTDFDTTEDGTRFERIGETLLKSYRKNGDVEE